MGSFVQSVIDLIVLSKPQLRAKFESLDESQAGTLPKDQWSKATVSVMSQFQEDLVTEAELSGELFSHWGLLDPVNYIQFLMRFQVAIRTQDCEPKMANRKSRRHSRGYEMLDARQKLQ